MCSVFSQVLIRDKLVYAILVDFITDSRLVETF